MVWVLKRLSNLWQINKEGKIADFGFKNGKDFGKQAAHPTQILWETRDLFGTNKQCSVRGSVTQFGSLCDIL